MKKEYPLSDRQTSYYFLKKDFLSAYKSNGGNIDLAIAQISELRMIQKEYVKSILNNFIKKLKNERINLDEIGTDWNNGDFYK